VTGRGRTFFEQLGIHVEEVRTQRRSFARACIDWTERRPHLAGSLGAALLDHALDQRWVHRHASDRSLRITPEGKHAFTVILGVTLD
jgi:hypothetical protein